MNKEELIIKLEEIRKELIESGTPNDLATSEILLTLIHCLENDEALMGLTKAVIDFLQKRTGRNPGFPPIHKN